MTATYDEKSPEALARLLGQTNLEFHPANNTDPVLPEYDAASYDPNTPVPTEDKPPPYSADFNKPTRSRSASPALSRSASPALCSPTDRSFNSNLPSVANKFYIAQKGNSLRPWPLAMSSELVTPIWDADRSAVLYTSTRFKKSSGTCVFTRAYSTDDEKAAEQNPLEVTTTYFFGPGNDPIISWNGIDGQEHEVMVYSSGKTTRSRWFIYNGVKYEWSYKGKFDGAGMILEKVIEYNDKDAECESKEAKNGGEEKKRKLWKGKGKAEKPVRVPIAEFARDQETAKACLGFEPAGHGGWVSIFEKEQAGESTVDFPEWLAIVTCILMLKRERDRRALHTALMFSGAVGGGS